MDRRQFLRNTLGISTALALPRPALPLDNPPPIKITGRQVPSIAVSGANSAQTERNHRERRRTARHDSIGDSDRCGDHRAQHPGRRQRNHHRSTTAAYCGHEPVPHRSHLGPHVPVQPQTGGQRTVHFGDGVGGHRHLGHRRQGAEQAGLRGVGRLLRKDSRLCRRRLLRRGQGRP